LRAPRARSRQRRAFAGIAWDVSSSNPGVGPWVWGGQICRVGAAHQCFRMQAGGRCPPYKMTSASTYAMLHSGVVALLAGLDGDAGGLDRPPLGRLVARLCAVLDLGLVAAHGLDLGDEPARRPAVDPVGLPLVPVGVDGLDGDARRVVAVGLG